MSHHFTIQKHSIYDISQGDGWTRQNVSPSEGSMVKHLPVVLALGCISALTGMGQQLPVAEQPATAADVERYFDAAHVRDATQRILAVVAVQVRQTLHDQILQTPGMPADAEQTIQKHLDMMNKNMASVQEDMLKIMETAYEKHFTKGDMDAMVAFYSSPTGQKLMLEQPEITAESMQASARILKKLMQQNRQEIQDQIAEIQENGNQGAAASPKR
jgi:uncharacterized protein